MDAFEFSMHFLHGAIALVFCIALLPMILSVVLSNGFGKALKRSLLYVLVIDILWNVLAFVEQLPDAYISESARKFVFWLGALCWVQYGYAIICTTSEISKSTLRTFWKKARPAFRFWHFLGIGFVILTGAIDQFYTGIVEVWYGYTATNSFCVNLAIGLFFILPIICAGVISFQSLQSRTHRVHRIVFITFATAIIGGVIMDIILPSMNIFIYGESACIFMILISVVLYYAASTVSKLGIGVSESLRQVLDDLDDGFILLNTEANIEFSNRKACSMLAANERILLQSPITRFIPTIKLEDSKNIPVNLKNGTTTVSATLSVSRIFTSKILLGYRIVLRDALEKEDFQKKLAKLQSEIIDERDHNRRRIIDLTLSYDTQKTFLDSLLDNIPARLWVKRQEGTYAQQNQKDIDVRGNRKDQIDDPAFSELEKQVVEAPGAPIVKNEIYLDPDGNKRYEKLTIVPLLDETQTFKGILGLIEDTTAFHQLEEERNQLRENLIKASNFEDMSNVAGGLAHDFNNILAGIIGYCELAIATLPKDASCEKPAKYLENMRRSMQSASNLVRRTYEELKLRESSREFRANNFNVGIVFDEVKNALIPMLPKNVEIVKASGDGLMAYGNPTDFHRIMMNMGKNAILAMAKNGGTLTYSCTVVEVPKEIVTQFSTIPIGTYLKISVRDTGCGMAPDVLGRIFTPYFTTRAPGQGSGIGLAVAMKLIKSAGAHVSIETTLGKGTNFELYWQQAKQTEDK